MAVSIIGPKFYAWDSDTGKPLAFGKVYTYQAGTNTPKATFTSEGGETQNANPVILNGAGYADIYLNGSYKVVVKDADDVEVWTSDPVSDPSQLQQEWVRQRSVTQVNTTTFTVDGQLTDEYIEGVAVRVKQDSGFVVGTVASATYADGKTTVTLDFPGTETITTSAAYAERALVSFQSLPKNLGDTVIYRDNVNQLEALSGPKNGAEALVSGVPFKFDGSKWYPSAGFVTLRAYGAVGSGDETTEISACVEAAASAKCRILDYTGKTYTYSSIISTSHFDYDGNATFSGTNGAYFYVFGQGFPTEIGSMTASASKGDQSIQVTATTGLSKGDIVILENTVNNSFSNHRLYYHDGEFNIVEAVTASQITLRDPIKSNYPAATTMKVFSASFGTSKVKGGRFISDAAFALRSRICKDVRVEGSYIEAVGPNRAAAMVLDRCFGAQLSQVTTRLDYIASGTGNYGLSVANSQNVISWGGNYHGGRHPIATGGNSDPGAAPCRNIQIIGAVMANDPASNVYAADFHGNTADSFYENCKIYGSVGLAGENVACRNSKVYARPGGTPLDMHEVVGGRIDFSGCEVFTNGAARVIGFASSTLANNIDRDYEVIADNLDLELDPACGNIGIFYIGATVKSRFSMNGLKWRGDFSGLTYVQNFAIQAGATKPASVRLENVEADISTITGWASGLGASTGTVLTMPKLSKTQNLAILAGNANSTSGGTNGELVFNFPAYPVIPTVEALSGGGDITGAGASFPVVSAPATTSEARAKMVMGTNAVTPSQTRSFRVTVRVGLDSMTI